MISDRVLGAYASIGTLPPAEQADWYRRLAGEDGITTFEIPLLAGLPLPREVVEALADLSASLVVTLVAQWATSGQENPAYGLSSVEEQSRRAALLDAGTVVQQCVALSWRGIRVRNLTVHTGQRRGRDIPHAISFYRSLIELDRSLGALLPECALAVEVTDCLPVDHPIPFPAAKKASLPVPRLIDTLTSVNGDTSPQRPVSLVINWGRLLVNGDRPLAVIDEILQSPVPLGGVILSGAGSSADGFIDSHNSHLDPDSGFSADDFRFCAAMLEANRQAVFVGMKCSAKKGEDELPVADTLSAQTELLLAV